MIGIGLTGQFHVYYLGASAAEELDVLLAGQRVNQPEGAAVALEDLAARAGGRHDNDHVDFRNIRITPTPGEVSEAVAQEAKASASNCAAN
jgi:hypothetical protein